MPLSHILKISRPRFWLYLAGPYLIGYTFAATSLVEFLSLQFVYPFLFFLIPANIFLYGINDLYDAQIDAINPKKQQREKAMKPSEERDYRTLIRYSLLTTIPLFFIFSQPAILLFFIFVVLSYFYSKPPIRFKTKIVFDSVSNILYAIPGFIGYTQVSGTVPPVEVIILALCWTAAMHLFSAIPDIQSDTKAGIQTTAIYVGKDTSLMLCVFLWSIAVFGAMTYHVIFLVGVVYPAIPLLLLMQKKWSIEVMYWLFPNITALCGFILFLFALSPLL